MAGITLCEQGHFVPLFTSADHSTAASSEVLSMENYSHCTIIIAKGAGSAVTVIPQECDGFAAANFATFAGYSYAEEGTAAGDTLSALAAGTTAGVAIDADTNTMLIFEIDATALSDGYGFIRITHDAAGASQFSAVACLSGPRFGKDSTVSAII